MIRRPPRSTRTDTLFPYTTLFRSNHSSVLLPSPAIPSRNRRKGARPHPLPVQFGPVDQYGRAAICAVQCSTTSGLERDRPDGGVRPRGRPGIRSEEHTSETQSLMRILYTVLCLKKKNKKYYIDLSRIVH